MSVQRKSRWLQCMDVVVLLMGCVLAVPAVAKQNAQDPNEIGCDTTGRFAFVWDSVELSTHLFSPSYRAQTDLSECGCDFAVTGRIHVLDANDLVGMQVSDPDILQVTDGDGNDVAWTPLLLRPVRQYQGLKYESPIPQDPFATLKPVLQPYDVTISFCIDPSQTPISALSSLQWCAYAVYAEDVIEVDVPFETTNDWLEVAPGVQIQVTKATVECCDYTYWTEVRHADGIVRAFDAQLSLGEPTADYLVVRTLLLDVEGNPVGATEDDRVSPSIWSERIESTSWNTAKCGGWLLAFATQAEVARIRHVIVSHPYEVKVPFVVRDLPFPNSWREEGFGVSP